MAVELKDRLQDEEFSLDDVNLVVARIPRFDPSEVDTSVQFTKRIRLNQPIIGSPMDTVTEPDMAILLSWMGGLGVIHAGMSIEEQLASIQRVRRKEAGFVFNPAVLGPEATIADVLIGERELGFSSYPITRNGTLTSPIIGIVTRQDVQDRTPQDYDLPVTKVMTPRDRLVFAHKKDTVDANDIRAANHIIRESGLDTLPILDDEDLVVALVTRSDIKKDEKYPLATKDDNKQLQVFAAVESRPDPAIARLEAIAQSGIAGIVIDSRNIYEGYKKIAAYAKGKNPDLDVIVGNIVHQAVLKEVMEEAGELIDGFRVGMGTGEVCITTEDLGIGRAMGSTLRDLNYAFQEINRNDRYGHIGFIADGGIKFPKHFLIAAALHRNFAGVMMGSALAGFDQSPSPKVQLRPGVYVKTVRGMGSVGAITDRAGSSRYGVDRVDPSKRYAEGIEKYVPAVGDGEPIIENFFAGVRTAMHALDARTLTDWYQGAVLCSAAKSASKGTL